MVNVGICDASPYVLPTTPVSLRVTTNSPLLVTMEVSIPVPPVIVSASSIRSTVSLVTPTAGSPFPSRIESATMFREVEIVATDAVVIRPCASTVNTGTAVALPYEPAATAVSSSLTVIVSSETVLVRPMPPAMFNLPVSKLTVSSEPTSPPTVSVEDTAVVEADVIRPCASTVNVGIAVALP